MASLLRWLRLTLVPPRCRLAATYYYLRLTGAVEGELGLVKGLVKTRGTAVDVGANEGAWSYPLSKMFDRVECFEPIPECASFIKDARRGNIEVHEVALSSSEGTLDLHIPFAGGKLVTGYATFGPVQGEYRSISIPVRRLDDYGFDPVAFIKIDVEGHELEVIRGAADTIRRNRPVMIVEIEQRHLSSPMSAVFDEVCGLGYSAFFLYRRKLRPIADFSHEQHQQRHLGDPYSHDYVHNFIFIPTDRGQA